MPSIIMQKTIDDAATIYVSQQSGLGSPRWEMLFDPGTFDADTETLSGHLGLSVEAMKKSDFTCFIEGPGCFCRSSSWFQNREMIFIQVPLDCSCFYFVRFKLAFI